MQRVLTSPISTVPELFSPLNERSVSSTTERRELADELEGLGIHRLPGGADGLGPADRRRYPTAAWCGVQRGETEPLEPLWPQLRAAEVRWEELPGYGTFTLEVSTSWLTPDREGGTIALGPEEKSGPITQTLTRRP